ncbi:MAG: sigma-54-dependent Fis family transcriptional regulator, partial [candidate division Zixibacteria bacterium]|nr:sigma-54-dependent Fis family transcriptional regulator [candidate division Zixibacteria bacterium]
LILGDTGSGKDLIARTIHFQSALRDQPFIEVNCTTLPKGLEEAELFGYEKGAFTGATSSKRGLLETAEGGAVFLNEIGDLTTEAQIKLLQVIENKKVRRIGGLRDFSLDVRIIAATNRDLKDSREFREDLFFRLNNLTIETPPLRERREDLIELAELFLKRFGLKYGVTKTLTKEAEDALLNYHWPGNVRELRQTIERVTFLSTNENVSSSDLHFPRSTSIEFAMSSEGEIRVSLPQSGVNIEKIERAVILEALKQNGGNVSESARALSLGREALRYRIKRHQITDSEVELS